MRASRPLVPAAAGASILATVLLAAGCSSSEGESSGSPDSAASRLTTNAQVACEKYYAFDLLRVTEVERSQDADEAQRARTLADYRDLATSMVSSVQSAVTVGDLPAKAQANADRILRQLARVSTAGGDIRDVSGAASTRIAKSAARIEALCARAGQSAPQQLLDARDEIRE